MAPALQWRGAGGFLAAALAASCLTLPLEASSGLLGFKLPQIPDVAKAVESVKDKVATADAEKAVSNLADEIKSGVSQARSPAEDEAKKQDFLSNSSIQQVHQDLREYTEQQVKGAKDLLPHVEKVAKTAAVAVNSAVDEGVAHAQGLPKTKSDELAEEIRAAAPQMAKAVNRTSVLVADAFARTGSRTARLLNRTGHGLATRIGGRGRSPLDILPPLLQEVPQRDWAASSGLLGVALLSCAAYTGLKMRGRANGTRPPVVLQETLMGEVDRGSSARAPCFRSGPQAGQEPLVQGWP